MFPSLPNLSFLLIVAAAVSTGCIAGAVPPSRSEVGTTLGSVHGEATPGIRVSTGAHWASSTVSEDEDIDIGAGYVYERLEAPARDIKSSALAEGEELIGREAHGGYLAVSKILTPSEEENHRTWLGLRGEFLHAPESQGGDRFGILTRLDWEVATEVEGAGGFSDRCGGGAGIAAGVMGLGIYAEAGAYYGPEEGRSFSATAGVTMRLPFMAGFAFDACYD